MNDYHVSSLVVYVSAEHAESVKKTIESLEGAEVPVSNEVGKMVVVLEGDSKDVGRTLRQNQNNTRRNNRHSGVPPNG